MKKDGLRDLFASVLAGAVEDFRSGGRYRDRAAVWIRSEWEDRVFSFNRTCEALDLDPRRVRKMIFRLPPAPPSRPGPDQDDELDPEA